MYKTVKQALEAIVAPDIIKNGFYLGKREFATYYRKSEDYLEMIHIGLTKWKVSYLVSASIVYLNKDKNSNNIDYRWFQGNIDEITPSDCYKGYIMKGSFGTQEFFFHNVYLALGLGIVGVGKNGKKPIGFCLQKYNEHTYEKVCVKILKRLPKLYKWLESMKK